MIQGVFSTVENTPLLVFIPFFLGFPDFGVAAIPHDRLENTARFFASPPTTGRFVLYRKRWYDVPVAGSRKKIIGPAGRRSGPGGGWIVRWNVGKIPDGGSGPRKKGAAAKAR